MKIPPAKAPLLEGKRGLVIGIANEHSIAWGCAKAFRALGAELAVTYLNDKAKPYVDPLAEALEAHLAQFVGPEPNTLVFTSDKGGPLLGQHFARRFAMARRTVGLDELHFHDLRHFAGTTAARTGATTRELMMRLGHSSPRAALNYQHATAERDHAIAAGLDALVDEARSAAVAPVVELPRRLEQRLEGQVSSPGTRTTLWLRYLHDTSNPRPVGG